MKFQSTPIIPIEHPVLHSHQVSLMVKREDLQHKIVSGNKLFKLDFHIQQMKAQNKRQLITYGGAYSNHLHATAFLGKELNFQTIGIVRGQQLLPLNPTLSDCILWGMILEPVTRSDYQLKQASKTIADIIRSYPDAYVIPEGGADVLGVKGAAGMLADVDQSQFDYIVCAGGTGTTIAGLVYCAEPHLKIIGIPVLKGAGWMKQDIQDWLDQLQCDHSNWEIETDYHFGGYAKQPKELLQFMENVNHEQGLELDPIYTSKAFYGLLDLIDKGKIEKGSRILFMHTGGLQGARS